METQTTPDNINGTQENPKITATSCTGSEFTSQSHTLTKSCTWKLEMYEKMQCISWQIINHALLIFSIQKLNTLQLITQHLELKQIVNSQNIELGSPGKNPGLYITGLCLHANLQTSIRQKSKRSELTLKGPYRQPTVH